MKTWNEHMTAKINYLVPYTCQTQEKLVFHEMEESCNKGFQKSSEKGEKGWKIGTFLTSSNSDIVYANVAGLPRNPSMVPSVLKRFLDISLPKKMLTSKKRFSLETIVIFKLMRYVAQNAYRVTSSKQGFRISARSKVSSTEDEVFLRSGVI